jgi:hypothetical protein
MGYEMIYLIKRTERKLKGFLYILINFSMRVIILLVIIFWWKILFWKLRKTNSCYYKQQLDVFFLKRAHIK